MQDFVHQPYVTALNSGGQRFGQEFGHVYKSPHTPLTPTPETLSHDMLQYDL